MDVDVFLDLDETLVHSRSALAVSFDLPLLYADRPESSLVQMRDAFDAEVSARLAGHSPVASSAELALLRALEREVAIDLLVGRGWQIIPTSKEDRLVGLRPGAVGFLEALAATGARLHLCSAATASYSERCLSALGIGGHFVEQWTRDDLVAARVRRSERPFLLVDNLPFEERDVQRKLRLLAGIPATAIAASDPVDALRPHHLEVAAWRGQAGDDTLGSAAGRVKAAVRRLMER